MSGSFYCDSANSRSSGEYQVSFTIVICVPSLSIVVVGRSASASELGRGNDRLGFDLCRHRRFVTRDGLVWHSIRRVHQIYHVRHGIDDHHQHGSFSVVWRPRLRPSVGRFFRAGAACRIATNLIPCDSSMMHVPAASVRVHSVISSAEYGAPVTVGRPSCSQTITPALAPPPLMVRVL